MANSLITGKRVTDRTVVEEIRTLNDGSLLTSDYPLAISRGQISGAIPTGAYGLKTTAGPDSGILWPDGVFTFPPSSGIQMSVVSTSANDTAGGTGIRTLDVHYLDANLVERVETVTLNGLTPVLTTATNIRFINCMHAVTVGSSGAAVGAISAYSGSNIYSYIQATKVRCSSAVRMVPAGKRMVVTSFFGGGVSGTAAAKTIVSLATPTYEGHDFITQNLFMPIAAGAFQDNSSGLTIPCPLAFTEGQVLGMTFETDKAATVVGSWFGWLEDV